MKKYHLLANLFLLLLSVFCTSCNGQVKTNFPEGSANKPPKIMGGTQAELQAFVEAGIDPYFVETQDTFSTQGPQCITRDLLQDKNGKLWLATWQGIVKYDGKVFTNYTLKEGLIHFHVYACYEDKKGNLWFGTARGGLYRYDGQSFTLFTTKDGLADNTVSCFAEDNEGNIWFGTDNGASRYNGKTFTNFTNQDGLSDNRIISMIRDKTGKLWFGTMEGISRYDGKSFSDFTDAKGFPIKKVQTLFEDKNGNIWIGRFDGLTRYDGKSFTEPLPNLLSYYMVEDKAGSIWFTHSEPNLHYTDIPNQVLYKYDGKTFTKIIEKYEPQDCQIFGKAADSAGNIWFGTMKGPCRYDGKTFNCFSE